MHVLFTHVSRSTLGRQLVGVGNLQQKHCTCGRALEEAPACDRSKLLLALISLSRVWATRNTPPP